VADITSLLPLVDASPGDGVYGATDPSGTPGDALFDVGSIGGAKIYPVFTPPVDGDFAWINQGGAAVDATGNGILLSVPLTAGNSLRIRKKAEPGATYVITAAFLPTMQWQNGNPGFGLGWRESGSGKLAVIRFYSPGQTVLRILSSKFTSPTALSADYVDNWHTLQGLYWLQIERTATDRIVRFSADGVYWIQLDTQLVADFLTPDEVCFFGDSNNGASPMGVRLLSWEEV
jgi:hypothetical protein